MGYLRRNRASRASSQGGGGRSPALRGRPVPLKQLMLHLLDLAPVFGEGSEIFHLLWIGGQVIHLRHVVNVIAIFVIALAYHKPGLRAADGVFGENRGVEHRVRMVKTSREACAI